MKKKIVLIAALAAMLLTVTALAEFVPCLTPEESHEMTEWSVVQTNEDGSQRMERTCLKCGYIQKGFTGPNAEDGMVATTRGAGIATTLSLDAPQGNPVTGAAV
ncbi:MAG: hypothetical protein RR197_05445 [Oscillospiraceae bacterium]